jgi:hypothetical protein
MQMSKLWWKNFGDSLKDVMAGAILRFFFFWVFEISKLNCERTEQANWKLLIVFFNYFFKVFNLVVLRIFKMDIFKTKKKIRGKFFSNENIHFKKYEKNLNYIIELNEIKLKFKLMKFAINLWNKIFSKKLITGSN